MTSAKIAFVWPTPPDAPTAAAVRLSAFLDAAVRAGVSTCLLVPSRSDEPGAVGSTTPPLYDYLAHSRGFLYALLRFAGSVGRLSRYFAEEGCKLVVASSPTPTVAFQAMLAAKLAGLRFVLDIRDSWEMESVTHEGRVRNFLKTHLERACLSASIRILCVTRTLIEQVSSDSGVPQNHFELVPNGADLSLFHPRQGNSDVDLVFAGSPAKYRNIPQLLEALGDLRELLPNLRVTCLGWFGSPEDSQIRALIEHFGLQTNISLRPPIRHSAVAEVLPTCRLGIVSLSSETPFRAAVGAKTYEYLASGLPLACLGPQVSSELRSLVEANRVGFYATSPQEFAQKAAKLLSEEDTRAAIARRCVEVAGHFDRRAIADHCIQEILTPLAMSVDA